VQANAIRRNVIVVCLFWTRGSGIAHGHLLEETFGWSGHEGVRGRGSSKLDCNFHFGRLRTGCQNDNRGALGLGPQQAARNSPNVVTRGPSSNFLTETTPEQPSGTPEVGQLGMASNYLHMLPCRDPVDTRWRRRWARVNTPRRLADATTFRLQMMMVRGSSPTSGHGVNI
jgi:hypothetical protein